MSGIRYRAAGLESDMSLVLLGMGLDWRQASVALELDYNL